MNKPCKLCASGTTTAIDTNFGLFHHCAHCDFIFKDDALILPKEEEKDRYRLHNNTEENAGYVDFLSQFIKNAILPHAGAGRDGLDFGSGPEPVLARLLSRDYGYRMDVYDPNFSPQKVYENKKYHLIASTEVVEHVERPMEVFSLLKSLLTGDGLLAVMTLLPPQDLTQFPGWHYIRDLTHISFYSKKSLEWIADEVGLRIVYTDDVRYICFAHKQKMKKTRTWE